MEVIGRRQPTHQNADSRTLGQVTENARVLVATSNSPNIVLGGLEPGLVKQDVFHV